MVDPILKIEQLTVGLANAHSQSILKGVSFVIKPSTITALVGGSGCGKSTTGLAIMQLLAPTLKWRQGNIFFENKNISAFSEEQIHRCRGRDIAMIFQDPLQALNPVLTIKVQLSEVLLQHTKLTKDQIELRIQELLSQVGLSDYQRILKSFPHQLSGGMRQRVMIAQAIATQPSLIIADEPTSSLDVTHQAKIIDLFKQLRKQMKFAMLLITHDFGIVEQLADEVVVMHQGRVVECAKTNEMLLRPQHPYTQSLLKAAHF